jgi:hypothetical protein
MLVTDPTKEYGTGTKASEEEAGTEETTTTEESEAGEQTTEASEEVETQPEPDLQAQLAAEREQRIRLEERLAAEKTPPPAKEEPPKVWTRAQLRAAVSDQTIDEDQMEEIWAKQVAYQAACAADERVEARDRARTTEDVVRTDTAKYIESHPDIKTIGTPDWNKLKSEYDYLVDSLGYPDNKATELAAMRAAFGPPDRIKESTARRRQASAETTSSQAGAGGGGGDRPVDIWNRVPKHLREPLKAMVASGDRTLEDIKKDIPYMRERAN